MSLMSKFVFGARFWDRLITKLPLPYQVSKLSYFELLIDRVIDIFFGNVKIDQEKENFNKDFGIKGEEPF